MIMNSSYCLRHVRDVAMLLSCLWLILSPQTVTSMKLLIYSVRPAQNGAIVELQPLTGQMSPADSLIGAFTNLLKSLLLTPRVRPTPRHAVESLSVVTLACMLSMSLARLVSDPRALVMAAPVRSSALDSLLNRSLDRLSADDSDDSALLTALSSAVKPSNFVARPGAMALASATCVWPSTLTLSLAVASAMLERSAVVSPLESTNRDALPRKVLSRFRRAPMAPLSVLTRR